MGDDAWLLNINVEFRDFNFIGDFSICKGSVTNKREVNGQYLVDIELECSNQRGVVSSPGTATVILPSKKAGVVVLPQPPADLALHGAQIIKEYKIQKSQGKVA